MAIFFCFQDGFLKLEILTADTIQNDNFRHCANFVPIGKSLLK